MAKPAINSDSCPVSELAARAARIVNALGTPANRGKSLKAALKPDSGPSEEHLLKLLRDRLRVIEGAAAYTRATSAKGALFQIYLASHHASEIYANFEEEYPAARCLGKCERLEYRMRSLMQSAAALLEAEHDDDDLRTLRDRYVNFEVDTARVVDQLLVA